MASASRAMPVGSGPPLVLPQLLRLSVLPVTVVPAITSPGALACSTIPVTTLCVIVLPLIVTPEIFAPGALAATTIWPITGPFGPNCATAPVTVLLENVTFWMSLPALYPPTSTEQAPYTLLTLLPVIVSFADGTTVLGPGFGAPGSSGPSSVTRMPPASSLVTVLPLIVDPDTPEKKMASSLAIFGFGLVPLLDTVLFCTVMLEVFSTRMP